MLLLLYVLGATSFNVTGFSQTTSVTLIWSLPCLDIVDSYVITYRGSGYCSSSFIHSVTVNVSQYTISGLQEGLTYEINITSNVSICKSAAATYRISTLPILPTGEFITYTNVWRYNP